MSRLPSKTKQSKLATSREKATREEQMPVHHPSPEVTRYGRHGETERWYVGVTFSTPLGPQPEVFIPRKDFLKPPLLGDVLADLGCIFPAAASEKKRLVDRLAAEQPKTTCTLTGRLGWHGDSNRFVFPDETIPAASGSDDVVFKDSSGPSHVGGPKGTLEDWKTVPLLLRASTPGIVAMCAAFVPPLMRFGHEEGTTFHLCGDSSTGKSTLLLAAASVWRGGQGAVARWNGTVAGVQELQVEQNDTLVCLDEIKQGATSNKELRELTRLLTYSSSEGQTKRRSKHFGDGRGPELFRVLMLSAGEVSGAAIAEASSEKPLQGEEVRFIDLPVRSNRTGVFDRLKKCGLKRSPQAFKQQVIDLKKAVRANHGTASRAFVAYIAADLAKAETEVLRLVERFLRKVKAPGDPWEQRFARKFALVYAAGRMAIAAGILPWTKGEVYSAVARTYRSARAALTPDVDHVNEALTRLKGLATGDQLIDLIIQKDEPSLDMARSAQAFRIIEDGHVRILVPAKVFKALADTDIRLRLLERLHQDGVYVRPPKFPRLKTVQRDPVKGMGRPHYFMFTEGLLGF